MTETATPFRCPVCFGFDRHDTGCSYAEAQSVGSRTARLLAAESARVAELEGQLTEARTRIAELAAQLERAESCPGDCPMRTEVEP